MTGDDMKALRLRSGLSQAALAAVLGMARESISRMERGKESVEKRTELALRYIVEVGLPGESSLDQVHQDVADVLADASVRSSPSIQRSEKLKLALQAWTAAGGSENGRSLIYRAQGVIGQINVSASQDPTLRHTMNDLRQVRLEWDALGRDLSPRKFANSSGIQAAHDL